MRAFIFFLFLFLLGLVLHLSAVQTGAALRVLMLSTVVVSVMRVVMSVVLAESLILSPAFLLGQPGPPFLLLQPPGFLLLGLLPLELLLPESLLLGLATTLLQLLLDYAVLL